MILVVPVANARVINRAFILTMECQAGGVEVNSFGLKPEILDDPQGQTEKQIALTFRSKNVETASDPVVINYCLV